MSWCIACPIPLGTRDTLTSCAKGSMAPWESMPTRCLSMAATASSGRADAKSSSGSRRLWRSVETRHLWTGDDGDACVRIEFARRGQTESRIPLSDSCAQSPRPTSCFRNAFANSQSRATVLGETFMTAAISSTLKPAK